MNFKELVSKRRSVHDYLPNKTIPRPIWEQLFAMVRLTPSGYNAQPWEFLVIEDETKRAQIQALSFGQSHITATSAVIIVLGDANIGRHADRIMNEWVQAEHITTEQATTYGYSMKKDRPLPQRQKMAMRSTCLAAMTCMYAATELGLATCPMMGFEQQKLADFLELPTDVFPVMMMTIGYEDTTKTLERLPRKAMGELVFFEEYGLEK